MDERRMYERIIIDDDFEKNFNKLLNCNLFDKMDCCHHLENNIPFLIEKYEKICKKYNTLKIILENVIDNKKLLLKEYYREIDNDYENIKLNEEFEKYLSSKK